MVNKHIYYLSMSIINFDLCLKIVKFLYVLRLISNLVNVEQIKATWSDLLTITVHVLNNFPYKPINLEFYRLLLI